jgi:signal transduction histidine kinase
MHFYHHLNLGKQVALRTADLQQAMKNLRYLASELAMTEERERRQIATDLHDRIGQSLTLCQMKVTEMASLGSIDLIRKSLHELRYSLKETIKDTRTLTFEISPPVLYDVGLDAALEELILQTKSKNNLSVDFQADGDLNSLSIDLRSFMYRSVRELLFNILKHANATHVSVHLSQNNETLRITVKDDGVGFHEHRENSKGFGLFSLKERLRHVGGALQIKSDLDQGTTVQIDVQLQSPNRVEHS